MFAFKYKKVVENHLHYRFFRFVRAMSQYENISI